MEQLNFKEIFKKLENITYFDLDEFLALDIYDLEKALTSGDIRLINKAKEILEKLKLNLKENEEIFNILLTYTKKEAKEVYKILKE